MDYTKLTKSQLIDEINKLVSNKGEKQNSNFFGTECYHQLFNSTKDAILVHSFNKDGQPGQFIQANEAACNLLGYTPEELQQYTLKNILPNGFWGKITSVYKELIENKKAIYDILLFSKNGLNIPVEITAQLFHVEKKYLVLSIIQDQTEKRKTELLLQKDTEKNKTLLRLFLNAPELNDHELFNYILDTAVYLTNSTIGFFHKVSEDQQTIVLTAWNAEALKNCKAAYETHYPIEMAGNWVDCVRTGKPVIYNNFPKSPNQKGLPEGHTPLKRFMSIPVRENGKVRFIFGVGNKYENYSEHDLVQVQLITSELVKILNKRKAAKKLKESEIRYRNLFDLANDAILLMKDNKFIDCNRKTHEMFGCTKDQIIGYSPDRFSPPFQPDGSRSREKALKKINNALNGIPQLFEWTHSKYDGTEFEAEVSLNKIVIESETYIQARVRDISSLKKAQKAQIESEEKYRNMIHNLSIGFFKTGLDGSILIHNMAFNEILGFKSKENLIGRQVINFWINPEERQKYTSELLKKGFVKNYIVKIKRKDQKECIAQVNSMIIRDSVGKPLAIDGTLDDITQEKKAEEELRVSEENLKTAQKVAHLGHWSLDLVTNELEWSEEIFRIFGLNPQKNKPSYDLFLKAIHPDDREFVNNEYSNSVKNKSKYDIVHKIIRPNGTIRYVNEQCKTYYDKFDKPLRSLGIIQDITKIKQAENKIIKLNNELEEKILKRTKQLRDSEEKSRLILESAGDGIIGINTRGKIVFINSSACTLLGYKQEEITGKKLHNLIHHTKADGSKYDIKDCPMDKTYLSGKSYFIDNEVLWRKDGTSFPVEYHSAPIKKDKIITGVVVTFKDISERKKVENELLKLSRVVEQNPASIVMTDTEGNINYINKTFSEVTGYTENEAIGQNPRILKSGLQPQEFYKDLWKTITSGKTWIGEFNNKKKDGNLYWENAYISPIVNKNNEIISYVAVKQDITDRKILEKKLIAAKKEADKANQAKSDFLANMSHEIRTPMHSIIGFTDILEKEIDDKIQKDYLNSIKSSSQDLLTIINDILDFSKIEAGKIELQYSFVNINDLFNEIKNMFTIIVKNKNIDFLYEPDPNLPLLIYTDEIRLKQILINLVNNAIKFTEEGYIRLTAQPIFKNKILQKFNSDFTIDLIIEIEDTGIGISEKFKEKIFESFAQQNGQSKKKFGGTGLGLAISKDLVNIMGGEITVQSEINKGSTFKILLKNIRCSDNIKKAPVISEIDTSLIVFKESKVIIVDNSEINRKFLVSSLIKSKIKIYEAENGLEAFELAKKIKPDLIITDLNMPIMDGFQLFSKLRENKILKHIPVIIVTASVLKRTEKKIIKAGFDGFLVKPFTQEDLHIELIRFLPYEKKVESEIVKSLKTEQEINSETLNNILPLLKGNLYNKWKTFQKHQPINEVNSFADELIKIGNKYNVPVLLSYGNHLKEAVTSFNIDEMLKLIKNYNQLLNKIAEN